MKIANLEKLRNHVGKTLEDVADELGVSKSTILNWEKNPENVPIIKLQEYAKALGYTLEDLIEKTNNQKVFIDVESNEKLFLLRSNVKDTIEKLTILEKKYDKSMALSNQNLFESIKRNVKKIQLNMRKPRLALLGESDAGKSSLINYMLSQEGIVPAHWSPATGVVVRIAHNEDKPSWLKDNTVVIKSFHGENADETWELSDEKYEDSEYFKNHVVESGGRELISLFGDRLGDKYQNSLDEIYTIYTFLDSDILKTIEIWDTPGIGVADDEVGESDETLSIYARTNADMLMYLSVSNQFMHSSDISYLRNAIKRVDKTDDFKGGLPAWHNLSIISSQADIISTESERNFILDKGMERLANQFDPEFFDEEEYDRESFKKRAFNFTLGDQNISSQFENAFKKIIENKDNVNYEQSLEYLKNFIKESTELIDTEMESNVSSMIEKEDLYRKLKDATDNLESILLGNMEVQNELKKHCNTQKDISKNKFMDFYNSKMNEEVILEWINEQEVKNKKNSKQDFMIWFSGKFQDKLEDILTEQGKEFEQEFNKTAEKIQKNSQIDTNLFDFKAVMAGLVTSGIVGGAFAIIAAGITSNLGLYILVAQIGGLLTTAGIISSPVVLTTFVSATLGPVGWVIALSILAGSSVMLVVKSSSWKKPFARKLIKSYEKQGALKKFEEAIDKYWLSTDTDIDKLKYSMDLVATENVKILKQKSENNQEDFEQANYQLVELKEVLENSLI